MALTKYASLESAEILDVKGAPTKARTASLDKIADFHDYRTEDGYLYARIRAISSRVNKNHDGWPSVELAGGPDIFDRHQASEGGFTVEADAGQEYGYSTFLGKPIFVDHHNSDPTRARGVIVDAKLHVEDHRTASELDPYYSSAPDNHTPPTWVELLLEVDAKSFPKLAKAVLHGSEDNKKGIDGFSMGCDVEKSVCNICKNSATAPDEYCEHVRMKGAHFDSIDNKTGKKVSKKSYEDCYGIRFFEISAVFDPADETALTREVRSKVASEASHRTAAQACAFCGGPMTADGTCTQCGKKMNPMGIEQDGPITSHPPNPAMNKQADNPLPQSDLTHAPEDIDTLRDEQICPVCGSSMDAEKCDICGYVEPPENLNNPDLERAQEMDMDADQLPEDAPLEVPEEPVENQPPKNPPSFAHVTNDMTNWQLSVHPKVAGRINPVERPIGTNTEATDEPKEEVVEDHDEPVTSAMRTAKTLIADARRNKENTMSNQKVAAEPLADAKADKRVDVEGIGGVMQNTNEEASKPRGPHSWESEGTTTDVEGKGGVLQDTNQEASKPSVGTEDVEKEVRTDDSGPTKTWDNSNEPGSAVTDKAYPTSAAQVEAAKQGVKPNGGPDVQPQRRENLEQDPANIKGTDTDQWTGTGGNGVTKQQNPVTQKSIATDGFRGSSHIFAAFKLADLEVEMGMLPAERKYERVAELEAESTEAVTASLTYAQKVKTSGLSRQTRTAKRMPSMTTDPQAKEASVQDTDESSTDESLFM